jgi:hypothetical protein
MATDLNQELIKLETSIKDVGKDIKEKEAGLMNEIRGGKNQDIIGFLKESLAALRAKELALIAQQTNLQHDIASQSIQGTSTLSAMTTDRLPFNLCLEGGTGFDSSLVCHKEPGICSPHPCDCHSLHISCSSLVNLSLLGLYAFTWRPILLFGYGRACYLLCHSADLGFEMPWLGTSPIACSTSLCCGLGLTLGVGGGSSYPPRPSSGSRLLWLWSSNAHVWLESVDKLGS